MAVSAELMRAVSMAREGDVAGALEILERLGNEGPPDENVQGFLFLLLKARGDLERALSIADGSVETATGAPDRSLWLLRRGLLHLDRQDLMRAMVDLNQVLRLEANDHHVEQARRALGRTLDPDNQNVGRPAGANPKRYRS